MPHPIPSPLHVAYKLHYRLSPPHHAAPSGFFFFAWVQCCHILLKKATPTDLGSLDAVLGRKECSLRAIGGGDGAKGGDRGGGGEGGVRGAARWDHRGYYLAYKNRPYKRKHGY